MKHGDITQVVLKSFYKVYNTLGYGFLERVYENALLIELRKQGVSARKQESIKVYYEERRASGKRDVEHGLNR